MSTPSRPPNDFGRRLSGRGRTANSSGRRGSGLRGRSSRGGRRVNRPGRPVAARRRAKSRPEADRGAASILILALGLTMIAAGLAGGAIGTTRIGRHRAHNAADLGALAGAMHAVYGEADACARAARFVTANGGRMVDCVVTGLEVVVRVQVEVRPLPGLIRQAEAVARAGPVYAVPD